VLDNPLAQEPAEGAPERLVTDPVAVSVMKLFDGCYELMTAMLLRFFAHSDESDEALATLVQSAMSLMSSALGPLGRLLTSLPAGGPHGDATAGPAFELLAPVALIPHRRAAWLLLHERLVELADFAGRLADEGAPAAVEDVRTHLGDVVGAIAGHLDRT
jgi:hypothetical protein